MAINVQLCKLAIETLSKHPCNTALQKFLKVKSDDPTARYGGSDTSFSSSFTEYVPKLRHAHLKHDLSIFYTIMGSPPNLKIYGVFTHDESGIGQPSNAKKQKSLGKTFGNQQFP